MRTRTTLTAAAVALTCSLGSGCDFFRGYADGQSAVMTQYTTTTPVGFYRLLYGDFQGLNTDTMRRAALSWKLLGAALLANYHDGEPSQAALLDIYRVRYGFATPTQIANWPGGEQTHTLDRPMGIVTGDVARSVPPVTVEVSNTGCSTCHSSTLYDADGHPTPDVAWVGAPNTNVNLNRYSTEAFQVLRWATKNEAELFEIISKTWPEVSQTELDTIKNHVMPQLREVVERIEKTEHGNFTPFHNGGTALTNGVGTIQLYMGTLDRNVYHEDMVAFAAMPSIGGLAHKRSILIDGVYAPPGWEHYGPLDETKTEKHRDGIAGVVTIISMGTLGVTPEVAVTNKDRMRDVVDYAFDHYAPPPFPGAIDAALADRGAEIFANRCSGCHGTYEPGPSGSWEITSYPNALVPDAVIGTDPHRWEAVTEALLAKDDGRAFEPVLEARRAGGYVAPPLDGIWHRAPYFHNASVPTLWHVLTPDERPAKFEVGGHRLDYTKLGIAGELDAEGTWRFPADHEPWTIPTVYDTSEPGRSNQGHADMVAGLTEDEKTALIEHLKRF